MDTQRHHRGARYPFVAAVEVTEAVSEKQVMVRTRDLSVGGCFAETSKPFPQGTAVGLIIRHGTAKISCRGRIAYTRADEGMGIAFSGIEPSDQTLLDQWLAETRDRQE
jgi:hypothetical protein